MVNKKIVMFLISLLLVSGCSIIRVYEGEPLKLDEQELSQNIKIGSTTKAEVLKVLGPPARFVRQFDGDIFVYEYVRNKGHMFEVKEPILTQTKLFLYKKVHSERDLLVVLFDKSGVVLNFGFKSGV
ncbi:MAG TPA: outer membrane protein assembly factor BamE [Thermodesulfovibrionia bacterium]|nr:outer membrane protein assembly factor BamE [Thermodesulfovibrionia bacterium]